ncbi:UBC core domain-containing protein [Plasmodiophora brassicae]
MARDSKTNARRRTAAGVSAPQKRPDGEPNGKADRTGEYETLLRSRLDRLHALVYGERGGASGGQKKTSSITSLFKAALKTGGRSRAVANGIGYGGWSSFDARTMVKSETKMSGQVSKLLDEITSQLSSMDDEANIDGICDLLTDGSILSIVRIMLCSDSLVAIDSYRKAHVSALAFSKIIGERSELASVGSARVIATPTGWKCLWDVIGDVERIATSAHNMYAKDETETYIHSMQVAREILSQVELPSDPPETESTQERPVEQDIAAQYCLEMSRHKFGLVPHFRNHHFAKGAPNSGSIPPAVCKRLSKEYASLEHSLPVTFDSSILVRASEQNLCLAKVLIFAPPNTPYANGAFGFDVMFPQNYPNVPPKVHFLTTGRNTFRFNPNLYDNGYVCLSLLGTWSGRSSETWSPETSTFLQVVISLQSMVLGVPEPYYNEPGYENHPKPSASSAYNKNIYPNTMRFAIGEQIRNPCDEFRDAIRTHFHRKSHIIEKQAQAWGTGGDRTGALSALRSLAKEMAA